MSESREERGWEKREIMLKYLIFFTNINSIYNDFISSKAIGQSSLNKNQKFRHIPTSFWKFGKEIFYQFWQHIVWRITAIGTVRFFMLSHVARASLYQNTNERISSICLNIYFEIL